MTEHRARVLRRFAVLAGLLALASSLVVPPAQAATRTVTLTANGPSPARLVLAPGDRVRFVNGDGVSHRVTSGSGWKYDSGNLAPGATSAPTAALSTPGTYGYTDTRQLLLTVTRSPGSLVVPAPPPPPSRSPSSAPRPVRSSTPATPAGSPTALPTDVLPTQPAGVPTGFPTAGAVPSPTGVAPAPVVPGTSPSPSTSPDVRYGDPTALAQHSPHRYGLPALLGLVAIGGVASLLLRFLLSLAPRRTGD